MAIEIRTASREEYPRIVETISTAFLERPDAALIAGQMQESWDPERTWLAVDGPTIAGTFRSWPTELTLPGLGRLPASAVSAVTVLPTHRRRGLLTRMAGAEHAAMRERGEALGLLYASEYPIYGRFGYGPATRWASWTVDSTRTAIVGERSGSVELVVPDEGLRVRVRDLYDAWRRAQPAELRRREFVWAYRLGLKEDTWDGRWKGWIALHRDASGTVDGYARYKAEAKWEQHVAKNRVVLQDLLGMTVAAERDLWAFLCELDLVATIRAENRSASDRIAWLATDPRAVTQDEHGDALWVRIFDVPRALAARTYEREGAVALEVVDDAAAAGRWRVRLEGGPDGATCGPTDRSPDLTLPIAALGSIYLGAHDLRDVALRHPVDEHRPGALLETALLFRTLREPWTSTFF